MTIEEAIQDLKQYIDISISQHATGLATKDDIEHEVDRLRAEMQELRVELKADIQETQEAIAETLTTAMESVASKPQVEDHERRITRLEHHPT